MDLLWLDVKRHYDNVMKPSDIYYRREKKNINDPGSQDKKQIIQDTINGLGGE